ncbi:MAG: sigma factor, partial [Flavobacteriaceae bacterium]
MKNSIEKNIDNLWQSFLNGDDKSFSILYAQYAKNLLEYGYKLCNHHELVDDSLQEIFIDLFIKRNKSIKNLKPYLFISFRNTLIKKLTENRKLRHFEEGVKK